jgi:hypothetical protein
MGKEVPVFTKNLILSVVVFYCRGVVAQILKG